MSTTTTLAPTTTIDPVVVAQGEYYAISGTYNAVVAQYQRYSKKACAAMAPAEEAFATSIRDTPWPAEAQDEADTLAKAAAAHAGTLYECARTGSTAAVAAAGDAASAAASAMRLALGLPLDRL